MRLAGLHIHEPLRRPLAWRDQHPVPGAAGQGREDQAFGEAGAPAVGVYTGGTVVAVDGTAVSNVNAF